MAMNVEIEQPVEKKRGGLRQFLAGGEFGSFGMLLAGSVMGGVFSSATGAAFYLLFTEAMGVEMVDLLPLIIVFFMVAFFLTPVVAIYQAVLRESAVFTFTLSTLLLLIMPIALGVRHGFYTATTAGWLVGMANGMTVFAAGLALYIGFLNFGREL